MFDPSSVRIHRFESGGFSAVGGTHTGVVRDHNEDRFAVAPAARVVAVADGMGGHEMGEEAARLAVEAAVAGAAASGPDDEAAVRAGVAAAQGAVAQLVRAFAQAHRGGRPPGCTLALARVAEGGRRGVVGWLGDSRGYLVHRGAVRPITADHATPGGTLTRCVGGGRDPADPGEVAAFDLPPGAQVLLCTDGLHGVLGDGVIAAVIAASPDRASAVRALVAEACSGGRGHPVSKDNVTAVLLRYDPR